MSRARSAAPGRTWLAVTVIAVLIVADVTAIALALNNTRPATAVVSAGPIPTFGSPSADPSTEPTATPTTAPTPRATATDPITDPIAQNPAPAVSATRIIAARDATTAWRLLTGDCSAARAAPQLTIDSGATWTMTDATAATGLTAVQRILVTGATSASLIGLASGSCAPQLVRVSSSGRNFTDSPGDLRSAWYVDPATPGEVHSPAASAPAPCAEVVALAPRTSSVAAVLCSDHTISVTKNGAATWSTPRLFEGSLTLTASVDGYVLGAASPARSSSLACTGIQMLTLAADLRTTATGCLPLSLLPQETMPRAGDLALSVASSTAPRQVTLWVWAGSAVVRSADGGLTWN